MTSEVYADLWDEDLTVMVPAMNHARDSKLGQKLGRDDQAAWKTPAILDFKAIAGAISRGE